MKVRSIVLSINLSVFAIWGLFFTLVINRPELIPMFMSIQAAMNLLGVGVFYLDRKPVFVRAFLLSLIIVIVLTLIAYYIFNRYQHLIQLEEGYTSCADELLRISAQHFLKCAA